LARDLNLYAKSSASCTKPDQTGLAFQAARAITDLSAERDALAAEVERLEVIVFKYVDSCNIHPSDEAFVLPIMQRLADLNHAAEGK
jgi:hypothetical protein